MNRIDVEIIELKIIKKGQLLLWIQLGKNGKVFRQGTGDMPLIQTQVDALYGHALWFHALLKLLPYNVFASPIIPASHLALSAEYQLKFYKADDSLPRSGLHVELAADQELEHPLMPLIEQVRLEALSLTESMYFDALMYATKGYRSTWLPQTLNLTAPRTEEDKEQELQSYLKQLKQRQGIGMLRNHAANKFFIMGDADYVLKIQNEDLHFVPQPVSKASLAQEAPSQQPRKLWWHFWK